MQPARGADVALPAFFNMLSSHNHPPGTLSKARQAGRTLTAQGVPNVPVVTDSEGSATQKEEEEAQEQPQISLGNVSSLYFFPFKHGFKLQSLKPESGGFAAQLSPKPGSV